MKDWTLYSKKELLSLPQRNWSKTSEYDFVLLVNTRQKHESGYNYFAVIGFNKGVGEIAGYMDDFRLDNFFLTQTRKVAFAIDCSIRGVFRIHSQDNIIVGSSTSTTFFGFKEKKNDNTFIK